MGEQDERLIAMCRGLWTKSCYCKKKKLPVVTDFKDGEIKTNSKYLTDAKYVFKTSQSDVNTR
jgi:hypothetical protein